MIPKTLAAAAVAVGLTAGTAGPALAAHDHFVLREDRDGQTHCRYIAQGQTESDPRTGDPGAHSFHDHVHLGRPGSDEHGTDFDKSANEDRCDTVAERGSRGQQ